VAAAVEQLAQLSQSLVGQPGPKQRPTVRGQAEPLRPVSLVWTQRTTGRRLAGREPAAYHLRCHPRRQTLDRGTRTDVETPAGHTVQNLLPAADPQLSPLAGGRVLVRQGRH